MASETIRKPSSKLRRQNQVISVRCTLEEKVAHRRTAVRLGFRGLSAWIKDLIDSHDHISLRLRCVMAGHLGQIGARLGELAETDISDDTRIEVQGIAAQVAQLQRVVIRGTHHVGESDS
jgi:hypothetical protein